MIESEITVQTSVRSEIREHLARGEALDAPLVHELLSHLAWELQDDPLREQPIFPAWYLLDRVPEDFSMLMLLPNPYPTFDLEEFLPPEYLRANGLGERAVVFALGVIGFKLLAGMQSSYRERVSLDRSMHRRIQRVELSVSKVRPDCPAALAKLIDAATHSVANERTQTIHDFFLGLLAAKGSVR